MITLSCLVVFGWMYEVLPFDGRVDERRHDGVRLGSVPQDADGRPRPSADGWTRYNFVGYEGRSAYPEYHDVVQTMDAIGEDATAAAGRCGRTTRTTASTARRWR